jgi:imidazolonepropionase-like amidohydrolase
MSGTITLTGGQPGSFSGTRAAPVATPAPSPTASPTPAATPPPVGSASASPADARTLDVVFSHGVAQRRTGATASGETLIRNATILTASHGTLANADILIRNGKIAAVGTNLDANANARVIDASGKFVTPGIVDCHSHTMLDAINEGSLSVTSMARIRDVLNPTTPSIYRELAGGVTTINALHGSANSIGGQNAVLKLRYGHPAGDFVFQGAPPGIKFALGENVKQSNRTFIIPGAPRRYPATRMGVEETIRDAFTRARNYKREWDEYRAATAHGDRNAIPPRRDLQLEPLVEVLEGKRYVHCHSYLAEEILMLMRLADEFGFKVRTFQHVLEGYKVAPELAAHGAMASDFADSWAYKLEAYDAIPYDTAIMTRAGVNVSVNSDSDERARRLNIDAAKGMKYGGLTEEEALRTITLNPAMQLGIDKWVGSIDVGKDADIVIWNGHPFSVYSRVEQTLIDGETYFDRAQDLARRADYQREREQLERAEPNRPPEGAPPGQAPRGGRRPGRGHVDDEEPQEGGNDNR